MWKFHAQIDYHLADSFLLDFFSHTDFQAIDEASLLVLQEIYWPASCQLLYDILEAEWVGTIVIQVFEIGTLYNCPRWFPSWILVLQNEQSQMIVQLAVSWFLTTSRGMVILEDLHRLIRFHCNYPHLSTIRHRLLRWMFHRFCQKYSTTHEKNWVNSYLLYTEDRLELTLRKSMGNNPASCYFQNCHLCPVTYFV